MSQLIGNIYRSPYSNQARALNPAIAGSFIDMSRDYDKGLDRSGLSNSHSAIQAAIDALGDEGGTLLLPVGNFRINSSLVIASPVRIVGMGQGGDEYSGKYTTRIIKNGNFIGLNFQPGAYLGGLQDIMIDGTKNSDSLNGVYIETGRFNMDRVTIQNQGANGLDIYNCNAGNFNQIRLFQNSNNGLRVKANPAQPDTNGMLFSGLDVQLNGNNGVFFDILFANTVIGATIQGNGAYGIWLENADLNTFFGIYSEANVAGAIRCTTNANNNQIYFNIASDSAGNLDTGTNNYISYAGGRHAYQSVSVGRMTSRSNNDINGASGGTQSFSRNDSGGAGSPCSVITAGNTSSADNTMVRTVNGSTVDSGAFIWSVRAPGAALIDRMRLDEFGLYAAVDNASILGKSSGRWSVVYSATGTINTSDERTKTFFDIEEKERAAAIEIKRHIRKFKFNDSIEKKGDKARVHFGVSAQQVESILSSHGLNPFDYAFLCFDKWQKELDAEGNLIKEYGELYGIRYDQLLCFLMIAI